MGEIMISITVEEYKRFVRMEERLNVAKDILDSHKGKSLFYRNEFYPLLGWEIPKEDEEE